MSYSVADTYLSCILESKVHEIAHVKVYNNHMILFFSIVFLITYFTKAVKEKVNLQAIFMSHIISSMIFKYDASSKDLPVNESIIQYLIVNQVL
jgi:hypothetical protein